jgi:Arc/MetJ family transcription regulator
MTQPSASAHHRPSPAGSVASTTTCSHPRFTRQLYDQDQPRTSAFPAAPDTETLHHMGTAIESPEERLRVRVGGSVAGSQRRVIPGYTVKVKTAISVPDETFEQASRQAAELGISRSEFFARAARRYLDELASRSLTQQVNEALTAAGDDDSAAAAAQAGRRRLAAGDEW